MNTVNNNSNKNVKIKNVSDILNLKAKEVFKTLCDEIEPGSTEIELDKLRNLISINSKKGNLKPEIIEMMTKFRLTDMIKEGKIKDKNYNVKINEKEFCEFLTASSIKNTLFNKNLIEKRKSVEDLNVIYTLIGGDKDGITKSNLNKNISKVKKLFNDPNGYFKDDFNPDSFPFTNDDEAQQIISLLSNSRDDKLTLQDFINAMSSDYNADFENMTIGL